MTGAKHNWLIGVAIVVSIMATNLCHLYRGFEFMDMFRKTYYLGWALSILLLAVYVFLNDKGSYITKLFLIYAAYNLTDELFFDPTAINVNEFAFAAIAAVVLSAHIAIKEFAKYDH